MFDLELAWDRPARSGSHASGHLLRVRLKPQPGTVTTVGLPLRVALALDTSSSMAGEKLERAREACRAVLAQLRPEDRLSLATFAGGVEPLLTNMPGGQVALSAAETALARLQAFGVTRTDLALDWLVNALPAEAGVHRIALLITDGHATDLRGTALTDVAPLIAQATRQGGAGISLCTVGLGDAANFNTAFLVDLSDRGRGAFLYADTPAALEPQLRARLSVSQAVGVEAARLMLRPLLPGLTVSACCRFRPELLPLDVPPPAVEMSLPLGALLVDRPTDVLIALQCPAMPNGTPLGLHDALEVRLEAPGQSTPSETAALLFTNSYAEAQQVNTDVDNDRLNWDIALYSEALHRTDDPHRTSQLLSDIQFVAQKTGRLDMVSQATQQLEELRKTGRWSAHRATGLLTTSRSPGSTP
jgi:Ca-activated chloride channel family protein